MALDEKRIETRAWGTRYRGELAIHAGQVFGPIERKVFAMPEFRAAFAHHGITDPDALPLGAILCTTTIRDVIRTDGLTLEQVTKLGAPFDWYFGDYRPGRRAWLCSDMVKCREPIPYAGAQGIRELPIAIAELVRSMTGAPR